MSNHKLRGIGKGEEFSGFLLNGSGEDDRKLQIYYCKQLSKCRSSNDANDCLR
jgi:hypothetical protein